MFEAAELGRKVSKKDFDKIASTLRTELLEVQQLLRKAKFPVIVVFAGVDGAGKGETVNLLNEWLDPRWMTTRAYAEPSEEERERPEFWRYWRDLPPKGKIGIFLSSWYSRPVLDRVYGKLSKNGLDQCLDRIVAFEKELADGGALIVKFWMHLGKKAQHKRLKSLENDPMQSWRVTSKDWKHWKMYDRFIESAEHTLRRSSTGDAPWTIVEGADAEYRALTVTTQLRDAIRKHLSRMENRATLAAQPALPPATLGLLQGQTTILQSLDQSRKLERETYEKELRKEQARLNRLAREAKEKKVSVILAFEGSDAAGKGGAIRRLTTALDARDFEIIPIAAPTDEERAQHYLWRFWRHLPRDGRFLIFDRSWYGRVLVERVEGFATESEWMRAYNEINDFEQQLVEHGIVLVKYWLHVTKEEQLRRFKEREGIPYKAWKLTDEDWRNREKWEAYEQAVNDMAERTSTSAVPWTLVEANDKFYARIKVIRTACDQLEKALKK